VQSNYLTQDVLGSRRTRTLTTAQRPRGRGRVQRRAKLVRALIETPRRMAEALALEPQIERLARDLAKCRDVLYLGRGTSFPLALEGALKLKEISYIHAEGIAAGEEAGEFVGRLEAFAKPRPVASPSRPGPVSSSKSSRGA